MTDMNGLIRKDRTNGSIDDSRLVIVTPTYTWRLPRVVEKWLRMEGIVGRSRAWFVMTCGDEIGDAAKYNRRLCESKDLEYIKDRGRRYMNEPVKVDLHGLRFIPFEELDARGYGEYKALFN